MLRPSVDPFANMWGSTSVACCPGATVKGSELINVRFAPTGFPGGGGGGGDVVSCAGEEEPEHPRKTTVIQAMKNADRRLPQTQYLHIAITNYELFTNAIETWSSYTTFHPVVLLRILANALFRGIRRIPEQSAEKFLPALLECGPCAGTDSGNPRHTNRGGHATTTRSLG